MPALQFVRRREPIRTRQPRVEADSSGPAVDKLASLQRALGASPRVTQLRALQTKLNDRTPVQLAANGLGQGPPIQRMSEEEIEQMHKFTKRLVEHAQKNYGYDSDQYIFVGVGASPVPVIEYLDTLGYPAKHMPLSGKATQKTFEDQAPKEVAKMRKAHDIPSEANLILIDYSETGGGLRHGMELMRSSGHEGKIYGIGMKSPESEEFSEKDMSSIALDDDTFGKYMSGGVYKQYRPFGAFEPGSGDTWGAFLERERALRESEVELENPWVAESRKRYVMLHEHLNSEEREAEGINDPNYSKEGIMGYAVALSHKLAESSFAKASYEKSQKKAQAEEEQEFGMLVEEEDSIDLDEKPQKHSKNGCCIIL